jgi:uncharacterized protein YggE
MDLLKNKYFTWLSVATVAMLFLFLGSATIHQLQQADTSSIDSRNTITVSGTGQAVAIPDIATFSFSVTKEAKTSAEAQKLTTDISNKILDAVKKAGVAEKDVKTTNYSLYPKYDYPQVVCPAIYPSNCPTGKEVLRGYEVSQSFDVKIRDIAKVGQIVSDATGAGATNISGPTFGIDKEDEIIAKARNEAINFAKNKAKLIADGLGVRLVRVVAFNENEVGYPMPMMNKSTFGIGGADSVSAPQLPVGENKYSRTVQVTYEIR